MLSKSDIKCPPRPESLTYIVASKAFIFWLIGYLPHKINTAQKNDG